MNNMWLVEELRTIDGICSVCKIHKFYTHKYIEKVSVQAFNDFVIERSVGKKAKKSGNWVQYSHNLPVNFHVTSGHSYLVPDLLNIKSVPIIEHESIFDFYKEIEYDYKKKKLKSS
jgi:hypothetical protein